MAAPNLFQLFTARLMKLRERALIPGASKHVPINKN